MAKLPTTVPLTAPDRRRAVRRNGVEPRTIAVPLLPPDADDDAWLEARRMRVSASEMSSVIGLPTAWDSPFSMWWKKQPGYPREQNMAMHIGSKLEAVIGELWAEVHPDAEMYRPGARLWAAPDPHDYLTATPDFLVVFDENPSIVEPLECKSDEGGAGWGKPGTDEIPEHHMVQVWQQCFVMGAIRGHVMRLAGKRATSYIIPFGSDERSVFKTYIDMAREFLARLEAGVPPDLDGHAATTRALIDSAPAVEEKKEVFLDQWLLEMFIEEGVRLASSKVRYAELRNRVRHALGDARFGLDNQGRRVVSRRVYKVPAAVRRAYTVDSIHREASYGQEVPTGDQQDPDAGAVSATVRDGEANP